MVRYINLCNYSYELYLNSTKHQSIYAYTSSKKDMSTNQINCKIIDYNELLQIVESEIYVPPINCFRGGGDKYYINIVRDLGLIVWSIYEKQITYISEYNNEFKKSSGYMLYTILKDHLCRYIFSKEQIPLHAALLIIDNKQYRKGIIIFGESGAGKSTLCYKLSENSDYKIYSDDLVVFDSVSGNIYGKCHQIFFKEDIVHKFQLEKKCKSVNGKWCLTLKGSGIESVKDFDIIFLQKGQDYCDVSADEMYNKLIADSFSWCRTQHENELYRKIYPLISAAGHIIMASYQDTNHILEVVRNVWKEENK